MRMQSRYNDLKVSDNVVIRNGVRLISLIACEKSTKHIDYLWFSYYKGGTSGFDFSSMSINPITSSLVSHVDFSDWCFDVVDHMSYKITSAKLGQYEITSGSKMRNKADITLTHTVNGSSTSDFYPVSDLKGYPGVHMDKRLSFGVPSQQVSVIYRGNLFIGRCFVFLFGCFAVLMTDDLGFDALCTVTGVRNLASKGYVLRIRDVIISPNPYIVNMVMLHSRDPELFGFRIIGE